MLLQKHTLLTLCSFIFAAYSTPDTDATLDTDIILDTVTPTDIDAPLDINELLESIKTINADVDNLKSVINKFDGMLSGIAIVKSIAKLKDDTNMATAKAEEWFPDFLSSEDSENVTNKTRGFAVKFVDALDSLIAKEPKTRSSGVRHHVPYQLEGLNKALTRLFGALADIVDCPDVQDLFTAQGMVDVIFYRAKSAYGRN